MVYYEEEDAERAKMSSDGLIIERTSVRLDSSKCCY
jgi:hypothetical protein